jgi:hypothetical protein
MGGETNPYIDGGSTALGPEAQTPQADTQTQVADAPQTSSIDTYSIMRGILTRFGPELGYAPPRTETTGPARPTDNTGQTGTGRTLELRYGQPDFDAQLRRTDYDTLKLVGVPENVVVKPWVDNTNGYFMWFANGNDNRAPHYFPPNLKKLEVYGLDTTKRPATQDVDDWRIQTSSAFMAEQNGIQYGFASVDARANPYEYARNMSRIGQQSLDFQERILRQSAEQSPTNPYFRIYLADILVAKAIKPVIDGVTSGQNIQFNNPETLQRLAEAQAELKKAQDIAKGQGRLRAPNTTMAPALSPFARYTNPDLYWGGALYQAWQREVGVNWLQSVIQSGALRFELPPALPPR